MEITKQEVFNKLEDLYKESKTQNFLMHIMHSYLSNEEVKEVKEGTKMRCAITGNKVYSVTHLSSLSIKNLDTDNVYDSFLAYQGHETNTYLSKIAFDCLKEWTKMKLEQREGKINWIVKRIKLNDTLKPLKKNKKNHNKIKKAQKLVNKPNKATLGDLDILKKLRDELS